MLKQFFAYYRPWKGLFWLDFSCAVASGLLELAFPLAVTAFIDRLLPTGNWTLTLIAAAVSRAASTARKRGRTSSFFSHLLKDCAHCQRRSA